MRNFILAAFFTLLGCALAGCDGGSNDQPDVTVPDAGTAPDVIRTDSQSPAGPEVARTDVQPATDTGLLRNDAGLISCPIPSPTGDGYAPSGFIVVTNDPRAACESAKAANTTQSFDATNKPVTPVSTSGLDCSDVAHDFSGTTGTPWCIGVYGDDAWAPCKGNSTGTPTCLAKILGVMGKTVKGAYIRSWGLCSPSGVFLGWACTQS